jgi:hypothetical protein
MRREEKTKKPKKPREGEKKKAVDILLLYLTKRH